MAPRIIYHDFTQKADRTPETTVFLTASVLEKGRRLAKTAANVNAALNTACIFLCGACAAVSIGILLLLTAG